MKICQKLLLSSFVITALTACSPKDVSEYTVDELKETCEENNFAPSCSRLGFLLTIGNEDIKQDYSQANNYLTKACSLKDGNGCSVLGTLYEKGLGVDKDFTKASNYYQDGCSLT